MNSANNADAYPYIANTTKKLDCAVKKTNEILSGLNVKTLYTKASGDGFVKNNVFAKDLNYEAGIYLGQYNDTKNILQNIKIYQTFLINSLGDMNVQVTKTAKNNDKINLPENSNTIFITPEYKIKLYSKDIAYSKDSRKILQNLNFSLVYYADINNKHYRLMEYPAAEESRFSVYTGLNSLDYINKNIESLPYDVLHKDSEFDFIIYAISGKSHGDKQQNKQNSADGKMSFFHIFSSIILRCWKERYQQWRDRLICFCQLRLDIQTCLFAPKKNQP